MNWRKNWIFLPIALVAILMVAKGVWNEASELNPSQSVSVEQNENGQNNEASELNPSQSVSVEQNENGQNVVTQAEAIRAEQEWVLHSVTALQLLGFVIIVGGAALGLWSILRDGSGGAWGRRFFYTLASIAVLVVIATLFLGKSLTKEIAVDVRSSIQESATDLRERSTEKAPATKGWLDRVAESPAARWVEKNTGIPWWVALIVVVALLALLLRPKSGGARRAGSYQFGDILILLFGGAVILLVLFFVLGIIGELTGFNDRVLGTEETKTVVRQNTRTAMVRAPVIVAPSIPAGAPSRVTVPACGQGWTKVNIPPKWKLTTGWNEAAANYEWRSVQTHTWKKSSTGGADAVRFCAKHKAYAGDQMALTWKKL